jgi:tRNA threonylcarbamoyladenosine biosynthesis protein TsaE
LPEIKLTVFSDEETLDIGRALGKKFPVGTFFLLTGELGAGKTTLTKGIAEGMSARGSVTSPAYTFVREHGEKLVHVDLYLMDPEKFDALGMEEYFDGTRSVVVEWADRMPRAFRRSLGYTVDISMKIIDEETREIYLVYEPLFKRYKREFDVLR